MLTLKEIEEYIKKNAANGNIENVLYGLIAYVEKDPAAPANVKLLNRTLKNVYWLAVLKQKENDGKKIN